MGRRKPKPDSVNCSCGSGHPRERCCGPRIDGSAPAETAEALMRSRYTAFTEHNEAYILATWDPQTRPASLELDPDRRWLGLNVRDTEAGGREDTTGVVEFVARARLHGQGMRLHERSRFRRIDGHWYYIDGDTPDAS
ncbi:YchJ family protein [Thioalkalivibrio sp. ALE23]|uniref:YchJ family protein n=1 Tax=Thioalkalivibrio sp. ALE23 TaxID=1265495 RepID=UPI000374948A|nr:YchJ family metal-binding protein [Thioalkalivibrio sp. ALE23]